jgi:hypothetical protein
VILSAFALASCGAGEEGMSFSISRSAIVEGVTFARIDVHAGDRPCDEIRISGPSILPSYGIEVDLSPGAKSGSGTVHGIRKGTYTVSVWTFSTREAPPLEFGCEPNIEVETGSMAEVEISLQLWSP